MKTNPNDSIHNSEQGPTDGLTKREHFAAMALKGLLSDPKRTGSFEAYAEDAVKFADALIEELNATPNND